jgi:hypothetical protein
MGGSLGDIFEGLRDALSGISGLLVADRIPEKVVAPMAIIALDRIDYPRAMAGGLSEYRYIVTVVVKRMAHVNGQQALEQYASFDGDQSLRAALTVDRTLGGAAKTLLVEGMENFRPVESDDGVFIAADFLVTVHA